MPVAELITCGICGKEFDSERARISHDNRQHGGMGTKSQNVKWCGGCLSYRNKDEFYKLNDGVYSHCKECCGDDKNNWLNTTTKGFNYQKKPSISSRYTILIKWAEKHKYKIELTRYQYTDKVVTGQCDYCHQGFQGIAFVDILQPNVGLTLGNAMFGCAVCHIKHKYKLK
jgi:NMD protein affecting ribosome stability and mRNA decay